MSIGYQAEAGAGLNENASQRRFPVVLDILFAVVGLVCLAPVIVLIALVICVSSGRPILYSQIRLGQGGRPFRLYKFRKFDERRAVGGKALTVENDPRCTRVGRFLEKTKLDELPQFWNILRGDMSVVGPRPETPNFADGFAGGYQAVLDHKPGIFGPTQAMFRNEGALHQGSDPEAFYRAVLFPAKARIDLAYYSTRTVMRDFGWIVACILAVLGWSRMPETGKRLVEELASRLGADAPPASDRIPTAEGDRETPPPHACTACDRLPLTAHATMDAAI